MVGFFNHQNIFTSFSIFYIKLIYKAKSQEIKQRKYIILYSVIHGFIYIYIHSQEFCMKLQQYYIQILTYTPKCFDTSNPLLNIQYFKDFNIFYTSQMNVHQHRSQSKYPIINVILINSIIIRVVPFIFTFIIIIIFSIRSFNLLPHPFLILQIRV